MKNLEADFRRLSTVETLASLETEAAIDHLARFIDLASEFESVEATELATRLGHEVRSRSLAPVEAALLEYFISNAWANYERLTASTDKDRWAWENPLTEKQIIHLRRSLQGAGFNDLHPIRQSQILTNLANLLDIVGRFVKAIELWNRAIATTPEFAMAVGNRGNGLFHYAVQLYDRGHAAVFLRHAHSDLCAAIASDPHMVGGVELFARHAFTEFKSRIEQMVSADYLAKAKEMEASSLGDSAAEVTYRKWCLQHSLFLNPLNDLGPISIAGHDCLTTPTIVTDVKSGPHFQGFYNQMKQEFVSARYLCFEGTTASKPHFSDSGVLLYNSLDYPSYSLAVEKTKAAFRIAYSLLDKVAFFLNRYLGLEIPEKKISFRSFWYERQDYKKGLRYEFQQYENWPLRGLFWLSKDMFENRPDFRECLEPDARDLDSVRNHAEHKYLKLHDDLWPGPRNQSGKKTPDRFRDEMAFSMSRSDFSAKTLRLLKMARAALVYLSLGIHVEEQRRAQSRPEGGVVHFQLDIWEDEWKI